MAGLGAGVVVDPKMRTVALGFHSAGSTPLFNSTRSEPPPLRRSGSAVMVQSSTANGTDGASELALDARVVPGAASPHPPPMATTKIAAHNASAR